MKGPGLVALLLAPAAVAQTAPEPPRPIAASKIVLVGDSTTAVIGGWGPSFCAYHVTSFAACVNLARGGRSSGSYRAEGSWDLALSEMRTPGYKTIWVLIQFGHNDQPGKPGRSTDLSIEFPANLARYVDEARTAGAKPVLLTPLTRRMFKVGKLQNDLDAWAAAVRKVAADKQVPLLDLNAESSAAVQAMGEAAADCFAQLPPGSAPTGPAAGAPAATEMVVQPMAQPRLSFDRTHLGVEGANYFAAMVTRELAAAVPEMRPLLVR
ncbi:rhamnogalacturonan acetylesterase [Sphingomonas psychrotolerans]|uniref:Lysophospholipase n=1 Tax=Sphingomonas psychrotolerans TaxID=1327635 RepID=A0A2K8MF14_9SPHN|nr:rhamnogalacturonan acetylesterase [Sphingomonas psychrotolerans]ATY32467.1 lysophospholipase [Sphingomonas psychrotolerans]